MSCTVFSFKCTIVDTEEPGSWVAVAGRHTGEWGPHDAELALEDKCKCVACEQKAQMYQCLECGEWHARG